MEAATEAGLIKSKTIAKSIWFVGKMNAIVDVCNSSHVFDKNPMKRPLSAENHGCIEVLEDFLTWGLTIHVKSKTGKLTRLPCFQALEGTVRGLLGLYSVMVNTYTSVQLYTVICNTDSVEQLFSRLRGRGGFNMNSSSHMVRLTFRILVSVKEVVMSSRGNASRIERAEHFQCSRRSQRPENGAIL